MENKINELDEKKTERVKCELCGSKLVTPETDQRKTAVCDECIKGQLKLLTKIVSLKHTFQKGLPFKMEVLINVDVTNKRYILYINGCQETRWVERIPNIEAEEN